MGMVSVTKSTSSAVPFHSLGLSQIISFGLLFYVFAQLKTPLAQTTGASETQILAAVTGALTIQALLAPIIGSWSDRYGALRVM
ncbi:MAG: MFS transporter, partial [Alphaproteobacteria bacterium]|nr:MFS transporter [Alphaproteobacteria bacterium]